MRKRYTETTRKESPLPFGYGGTSYATTVKDNETGVRGRGTGNSRGKSISEAWRDLREKQGK